MSVFRAFGVTDKGRVRPANEDCFAIHEDLGLAVVADGMGGHNAGEVAARMAVDAIVDYFTRLPTGDTATADGRLETEDWPFGFDPALSTEGNRMRTAILVANVQILESAITTDGYAGMGTTVVAARVVDGRLVAGHVGDSRLYSLSGGAFKPLTADDSWMAAILAHDPAADPAVLRHHPMRHALTNVVGARSRTEVHVVESPAASGDVLLLTTDGVHEVLDDYRLEQLVRRAEDPKVIAQTIVTTALAGGTRDNLTAVVVRVAG
jgi:PPM family protein phosphatase